MKKIPLTLLSAAAIANSAMAEDHLSVHYLNYSEHDDKVKAKDTVVSLEKSFGLDWTLNLETGYDTISGASPSLGATTPLSGAADFIARRNNIALGQAKTDEVLRSDYDPQRSGYKVNKIKLKDRRKSINGSLTYRDEKRNEWTFGANYSTEEDYKSVGLNGKVLVYENELKNRSYSLGVSTLFDKTLAFNKFTTSSGNTQDWQNIFTGSVEAGLSQTFNPQLYMVFTGYAGYRSGYLSNHYLTVLREIDINNNGSIGNDEVFVGQDSRPDKRYSGGVNIQAFWAISDEVVVRPRYKWFMDDWGVRSHQIGSKMTYKATEKLTIAPGYFWYKQEGASFYKSPTASDNTFAATGFATSDLRLGDYTANAYEIGISYKLFSKFRLNALGAYYEQSNGFKANWWAVGATYEF